MKKLTAFIAAVVLVVGLGTPGFSQALKVGWHLDQLKVKDAWEHTKGEGVVAAVISDGVVDFDHIKFNKVAWNNQDETPDDGVDNDKNGYVDDYSGWDFVSDAPPSASNPKDTSPNGTYFAGLVAAQEVGIAPRAKIIDLRVSQAEHVVAALKYARAKQADIVLLPLITNKADSLLSVLDEEVLKAAQEDIVVVGYRAAGKGRPPVEHDRIFTAASVGPQGELHLEAEEVPDVDFTTSGISLASTGPGDKVALSRVPGDGAAASCLAGTVSLMLSLNPELNPEQVYDILASTAEDLGPEGRDEKFGWGLINTKAAVERVLETKEE